MLFHVPSTDIFLWHTVGAACVYLTAQHKCAKFMANVGPRTFLYPWQSHGFIRPGSRLNSNSLCWAVCVMSAFSWICLNCQNKAIQRSVLIGMVYNWRQLLYIQKSHNTGNTGGLVYIFPWSNVELANVCSEGLLPRFGSYCTYTRNEMLAKKC